MMFANNLKLFLRLAHRHFIYYLISVGGLTAGVSAFFFIATYVGYELSYDDLQVNADRLYRVASGSSRMPVPLADAIRKEVAGVENTSRVIFTASGSKFIVRDTKGNLVEQNGYYVDSTFFDLFNYAFKSIGSTKPLSQPDQMVITQRMAEKYFGNDDPVGKTIELANTYLRQKVYNIVGVIENPQVNSQFEFDFLVPFVQYGSGHSTNWSINLVYTYVLLESGTSADVVLAQIRKLLADRVAMTEAEINGIRLQPFQSLHFDSTTTFDYGQKNAIENLWILSSVAVLILVIAGINFINLSTARASDRMKEVSMKKVLGASRRILMVQFISEAIIIATLSCVLSLVLIVVLRSGFESMTGVSLMQGWKILSSYGLLLLSVPFVIGLLAGVYPAVVISSTVPVHTLKGARQAVRSPLRTALVVIQFSITVFLVIGTGVIVAQMNYMQNKDLGFNDDLAVILNVGGPGIGPRLDLASKMFSESADVVSTSGTLTLPGDNTYTMPYSMTNTVQHDDGTDNLAGFYVDHDFINNMNIEVIKGRAFSKELGTDTLNFLLNEAAVKKLRAQYGDAWDEPVGQKLNYFRSNDTGWYVAKSGTVIGVVRDFNFASLHHAIEPMAIQVDYKLMYKLVVKIRPENVPQTLEFLERKWKELGIERPFNYQFLDQKIAASYARETKFRALFSVFAVLSIVISCIGLYGLVLYTTEKRSREMSIRKVLGASSYGLAVLIGSGFFKPVVIAFAVASPIAWYSMNQWLNQFAFKEDLGIWIFLQAGFLCAALAMITVLVRVLKVTRANPVKYLKDN